MQYKLVKAATMLLTALVTQSIASSALPILAKDTNRFFSHPDRIRYDGQCLTLDGKDVFIYSGSFHYFRCAKELWPARFAKIKAAGFNCVDTYIPWNLHERQAPRNLNDFSQVDLRDIEEWLNLAEQAGLYVIARPGPFICAEWDRGGFPGWLITKKPANWQEWSWFRSNDPEFIAWTRHWYDALFPLLARHQVTRKAPGQPGVIMVFVENEYDHFAMDSIQRAAAVKTLTAESLAQGIDVPLVTCETDCVSGNQDPVLRRVFNVRNAYPGWNVNSLADDLNKQHASQPDAPLMIGEAQGGWFTFVWQTPAQRPDKDDYREDLVPAQINNLTLFAFQNGVTILNYYMLFGGSNLGDTAGKDIATSYDFSAAIRECGGVGEKYQRVAAIGQMLKEHGPRLARSKIIECNVSTDQKDVTAVMRQSANGDRYVFVRTDQHSEARHGTAHLQPRDGGQDIVFDYQLEPFGSKVFYLPSAAGDSASGQWLPRPFSAQQRPGGLPLPIKINEVSRRVDGGPSEWKTFLPGSSLNDIGIYDSRFVFYRASFSLSESDLTNAVGLCARIAYPTLSTGTGDVDDKSLRDHVLVSVNGQSIGEADVLAGDVLLPASVLHAGKNQVTLLYQNSGCLKEGNWMEKEAGVRNIRLLPAAPTDQILNGWKMQPVPNVDGLETLPEIGAHFDDLDWKPVKLGNTGASQLTHGQTAVFRTTFDMSELDIQGGRTGLFISQAADYGWVFVNGKKIGEIHTKITSHTFDMAGAVHPGSNTVAIVVSAVDLNAAGGIGLVAVTWPETAGIQPDRPLEYSDLAQGVSGHWQEETSAESAWGTHALPEQPSSSNSLLTWHRLSFQMPATSSGIWVPWLVRLHALGDGFIYLNGHALGRYWEAGGQNDYYLPECWLNSGKPNVITLCLRPGKTGSAIQSAEIIPYAAYAETEKTP